MNLPTFRYHPDPIGTGSIVESPEECCACGEPRGFVYAGPVYAEEDLDDALCPWCIADGTAHEQFAAEFVDAAAIGGDGEWDAVPPETVEEVAYRTPGFSAWQQEKWFTHCGDAAAFLGPAGWAELKRFGQQAIDAIAEESGLEGDELEDYLHSLDRDGGPTAYMFRCRNCNRFGGYSDRD
jgi:uncharacterized protein CbrC (UPF0167 family)